MAWSPPWNAPEVDPTMGHSLDFDGIKRADIYSFGLVVVSIVIGRDVFKHHSEFEDEAAIARCKSDGSMFNKMVKLVEEEDKQRSDSDFDLVAAVPPGGFPPTRAAVAQSRRVYNRSE